MSESVHHELFGTLTKTVEKDGTIDFMGELSIDKRPAFRLHITGAPDASDDEILRIAATAHHLFVAKEPEILKQAVSQSVSDSHLKEIEEDTEEPMSRADAEVNYAKIFILNYYTELDEVSIFYEDESGYFGTDIQVEANLAFTEIKVG